MFELYQLEQLLAVAECGTLSGAAERLHISQPALSRSMQRLETELQVPLFTRQKNKIELNKNGRMAVDHARKIMDQAQDMVSRVQAYDRSRRTILVGSCAPAPLWEIPPLLSGLYPDRTVSSEIRENDVLLQGLRDDVYQLIILPYPVEEPGIACVKYGEEHLFFSLPPVRQQGAVHAGSQRRDDAPPEPPRLLAGRRHAENAGHPLPGAGGYRVQRACAVLRAAKLFHRRGPSPGWGLRQPGQYPDPG